MVRQSACLPNSSPPTISTFSDSSPARGRFFSAEEDAPGEHAVAVLNYADWQTRFGGASDIVGRTVVLNNLSSP